MQTQLPGVAGAAAALDRVALGRGKKSAVHLWLEQNHAELSAVFARRPPARSVLADYLAEHGLTTADGCRPSPESVRTAWRHVVRTKQRR